MKKKCGTCGGVSDFDLEAIATDLRDATAKIAEHLGVPERRMENLGIDLTCKHCGAKIPLRTRD